MSVLETLLEASKQATTVVAMHTNVTDEWYIALTYFEHQEAIFTITSTHRNIHEAYRLLEQAQVRVDSDYAAGWLSLPDMGDFKVEYHRIST